MEVTSDGSIDQPVAELTRKAFYAHVLLAKTGDNPYGQNKIALSKRLRQVKHEKYLWRIFTIINKSNALLKQANIILDH